MLASDGLKRQKFKRLLPRYNEESQKTTFSQAKTPFNYSDLEARSTKPAKLIGPRFYLGITFNFLEI